MKLFLSFFVVTVAAFAHGFPSETELEFDVFSVVFLERSLPVNDEQIQCIRNGTDKIVEENPDLKSWFDEVEKICEKLKEKALICDSYSGIKKKACFAKLKVSALAEYNRLINSLPKDRKEIVDEIKTIVKGCLKS